MARKTPADELSQLIDGLRKERQEHLDAIIQIDKTFEQFGIAPNGKPTRGRPGRPRKAQTTAATKAGKTGKRRGRKRGSFEQTAEESVLNFVTKHGNPNAAEVNQHWQKEGRGGKADNTLTKLVKEGKLKRISAKGERGGRYQVT